MTLSTQKNGVIKYYDRKMGRKPALCYRMLVSSPVRLVSGSYVSRGRIFLWVSAQTHVAMYESSKYYPTSESLK
jgi:hypothetical protein